MEVEDIGPDPSINCFTEPQSSLPYDTIAGFSNIASELTDTLLGILNEFYKQVLPTYLSCQVKFQSFPLPLCLVWNMLMMMMKMKPVPVPDNLNDSQFSLLTDKNFDYSV